MIKPAAAIICMFMAMNTMAQNNVRLEIRSLPEFHAPGSDIYVAGSFNGWNAQDSNFRFNRDDLGNYFIILPLNNGTYEYKITKGGWENVECKKDGSSIPNHILQVQNPGKVILDIEAWADRFPGHPKPSTASKNVHIIDANFFIPQLNRTRRVWIYLPGDYSFTQTRYPVLYMQDGQNIFDEATAFANEWGVDEWLDSAGKKTCIVVAIDNGGASRMTEYNPYDHEKFGRGEGNQFADFLVGTIKPYIDTHFRTLHDKPHTFIAGSSMGALISFYCVLKYPDAFGRAGIFSPSFWLTPEIFNDIQQKAKSVNTRIYFYCGKPEGASMTRNMLKVVEAMRHVSRARMETVVRKGGNHDEISWRKEFPSFYQWLLK